MPVRISCSVPDNVGPDLRDLPFPPMRVGGRFGRTLRHAPAALRDAQRAHVDGARSGRLSSARGRLQSSLRGASSARARGERAHSRMRMCAFAGSMRDAPGPPRRRTDRMCRCLGPVRPSVGGGAARTRARQHRACARGCARTPQVLQSARRHHVGGGHLAKNIKKLGGNLV